MLSIRIGLCICVLFLLSPLAFGKAQITEKIQTKSLNAMTFVLQTKFAIDDIVNETRFQIETCELLACKQAAVTAAINNIVGAIISSQGGQDGLNFYLSVVKPDSIAYHILGLSDIPEKCKGSITNGGIAAEWQTCLTDLQQISLANPSALLDSVALNVRMLETVAIAEANRYLKKTTNMEVRSSPAKPASVEVQSSVRKSESDKSGITSEMQNAALDAISFVLYMKFQIDDQLKTVKYGLATCEVEGCKTEMIRSLVSQIITRMTQSPSKNDVTIKNFYTSSVPVETIPYSLLGFSQPPKACGYTGSTAGTDWWLCSISTEGLQIRLKDPYKMVGEIEKEANAIFGQAFATANRYLVQFTGFSMTTPAPQTPQAK